jgi:hypothetical protein
MKALWIVPCLLAAGAWADEAGDRAAIEKAVAAFNDPAIRESLFAADVDAAQELRGLERSGAVWFEDADRPWPEVTRPKIAAGHIRFITPDVALVDAALAQYGTVVLRRSLPLLFVMKREGGGWKISALRVMSNYPAPGVVTR